MRTFGGIVKKAVFQLGCLMPQSIGIEGFHLIEQKRAFSLGFLLSSSADSATPAVISENEPSGGCSV